MIKSWYVGLFVILVAVGIGTLFILLPDESLTEQKDSVQPPPSPSFGTTAELSLSNAPKLNEEAQLTFTISVMPEYNKAINNLSAEIVLPEGFVHVSGDLTWQGDLNPGQSIQITSTIKSVKTGDWSIGGSIKGAFDYLYVTVSEGDATISREPFKIKPDSTTTEGLNSSEVREYVP